MMALGKLPDDKIEDAIYYDAVSGNLIVFSTNSIKNDIDNAFLLADNVRSDVNDPNNIADRAGLAGSISVGNANAIRQILLTALLGGGNLSIDVVDLKNTLGCGVEYNQQQQQISVGDSQRTLDAHPEIYFSRLYRNSHQQGHRPDPSLSVCRYLQS